MSCVCVWSGSGVGGQEGGMGVQGSQTDDEDTLQKGVYSIVCDSPSSHAHNGTIIGRF